MKQLEEKIKERLEGFVSSLPEGDLSEFKEALHNGTRGKSRKQKISPAAWLIPIAAAAAVALIITWGDTPTEANVTTGVDNNPKIAATQTPPPAATSNDTTRNGNSSKAAAWGKPQHPHVPSPAVKDIDRHSTHAPSSNSDVQPGAEYTAANTFETSDTLEHQAAVSTAAVHDTVLLALTATPVISDLPLMQQPQQYRTRKIAAGIVGGTGVTAALIKYLPTLFHDSGSKSDNPLFTDPTDDVIQPDTRYYMPLRAGISLRIPFNDRWSLTLGIDYSWYRSKTTFPGASDIRQKAMYIGIPLRADYTVFRNKKWDVYAGAGIKADFCVATDYYLVSTKKDVRFSIDGVGGVQYNLTKSIGLYLEPTVSWNLPTDGAQLPTYKSQHPVMFSVSPGLRFTLDNN